MASLFSFDAFPGFDERDYDAFAEQKWASNRFNMERMRVTAKMEALARALKAHSPDLAAGFSWNFSPDHPCIFNGNKVDAAWLFLARTAEEQKAVAVRADRELGLTASVADPAPYHRYAVLAVRVHFGGVETCLRIHKFARLDGRNLLARCMDADQRTEFLGLLAGLGEGFVLQTVPDLALLEAAGADPQGDWVCVTRPVDRGGGAVAPEALVADCAASVRALIPLYRFSAWSPDSDYLIKTRLEETASETETAVAALPAFEPGNGLAWERHKSQMEKLREMRKRAASVSRAVEALRGQPAAPEPEDAEPPQPPQDGPFERPERPEREERPGRLERERREERPRRPEQERREERPRRPEREWREERPPRHEPGRREQRPAEPERQERPAPGFRPGPPQRRPEKARMERPSFGPRFVASGAPGSAVTPGDYARVLSGILLNQVGSVMDVDLKAGVRLAIGRLQVRLPLVELQKVVPEV